MWSIQVAEFVTLAILHNCHPWWWAWNTFVDLTCVHFIFEWIPLENSDVWSKILKWMSSLLLGDDFWIVARQRKTDILSLLYRRNWKCQRNFCPSADFLDCIYIQCTSVWWSDIFFNSLSYDKLPFKIIKLIWINSRNIWMENSYRTSRGFWLHTTYITFHIWLYSIVLFLLFFLKHTHALSSLPI